MAMGSITMAVKFDATSVWTQSAETVHKTTKSVPNAPTTTPLTPFNPHHASPAPATAPHATRTSAYIVSQGIDSVRVGGVRSVGWRGVLVAMKGLTNVICVLNRMDLWGEVTVRNANKIVIVFQRITITVTDA